MKKTPTARATTTTTKLILTTKDARRAFKIPLTDTSAQSENATHFGVTLTDFCNRTGILRDTGPLNIFSESGQSATLNTFAAVNSTRYPYDLSYNVIVLALMRNGQWMTNQTFGLAKLVAPDFASNHQIEQVTETQTMPFTCGSERNL